jgi:hypothetical protein
MIAIQDIELFLKAFEEWIACGWHRVLIKSLDGKN